MPPNPEDPQADHEGPSNPKPDEVTISADATFDRQSGKRTRTTTVKDNGVDVIFRRHPKEQHVHEETSPTRTRWSLAVKIVLPLALVVTLVSLWTNRDNLRKEKNGTVLTPPAPAPVSVTPRISPEAKAVKPQPPEVNAPETTNRSEHKRALDVYCGGHNKDQPRVGLAVVVVTHGTDHTTKVNLLNKGADCYEDSSGAATVCECRVSGFGKVVGVVESTA